MNSPASSSRTAIGKVAAVVLLSSTLFLMVLGALVNSFQAAGSVPDWPLSYGRWTIVGSWAGNAVIEHSHRLATVGVGLALLAYVLFERQSELPDAVAARRLRVAGLLLLGQILFGGAVVLLHAPPWMTTAHSLTAQVVFLTLGLTVFPPATYLMARGSTALTQKQRRLATVTSAAVSLQVVLGILARHPQVQLQLIVTLLSHLAVGLFLLVLIPWTAIGVARRSRGPMRSAAIALLLLFVLQLLVAAPLLIVSPEPLDEPWPPEPSFPPLHAAHVALAALILTTAWWLRLAVNDSAPHTDAEPGTDPE